MSNTGTTRLVILAALVLGGILVLAKGFAGGGAAASAPATSTSPSVSVTHTTTKSQSPAVTLSPQIQKVKIVVFNAGFSVPNVVAGLAGALQQKMENDGYVAVSNATNATVDIPKSIVYFTDRGNADQNKVDAQYIADTYLDHARVAALSATFADTFPPNAQVVILLGEDYIAAHANG